MNLTMITQRIKTLEGLIAKSVDGYNNLENNLKQHLANHNALLGALNESKTWLDMATKTADAIAPESPVAGVLDAVDAAASAISDVASPEAQQEHVAVKNPVS